MEECGQIRSIIGLVALFCALPAMTFADDAPSWVTKTPKDDADYKYYVGISDPMKNKADAIKEAYQNAVEDAIKDNFGFNTQINKETYENLDQAATTARIQEQSKKVEIHGFELRDEYFREHDGQTDASELFRYSKKEIQKEKTRLEKQTKEPSLSTFSSLGDEGDPNTGTLSVGTRPSHASIFVDGEAYGKTNATIHGLSSGEHLLSIEHDDYEPIEEKIIVPPGQETTVIKTLQKAKGTIQIQSDPDGAIITLNGKSVGTTPTDAIEVVAGEKLIIKATHPEAESQIQEITVGRKEEKVLKLTLPVKPSYLIVHSDPPGADLSVNGEDKGVTGKDGTKKVEVPAGTLEVKIEKHGYVSDTETAHLFGGQTLALPTVRLTLISEQELQRKRDEEQRRQKEELEEERKRKEEEEAEIQQAEAQLEQEKQEAETRERQKSPPWRIYLGFGWSGAPVSEGCSKQSSGGNSYCEFFDLGFQRQLIPFLGVRLDYRNYFDGVTNPQTATPSTTPSGVYSFSSNEFTFRAPIYPVSYLYLAPEAGLSEGKVSVTGGNTISVEQHFLGGAVGAETQFYRALGGYLDMDYRHYGDASGYSGKGSLQGSFGLSFGF